MASSSSFFDSSALNMTEVNLGVCDSDMEDNVSDSNTLPFEFSESDRDISSESEESIMLSTSEDEQEAVVEQPVAKKQKTSHKKKKQTLPDGFDVDMWEYKGTGDAPTEPSERLPAFDNSRVGIQAGVHDGVDELYFFELFITDELVENITHHTNLYYDQYMENLKEPLPEKSRIRLFKHVSSGKMRSFLLLTYYMGLIKKNDLAQYWSVDDVLSTPFVRKMMSRDDFKNIMTFFHLCDNSTYVTYGNDGHDPRLKLGEFYTTLCESFTQLWTPRENISIDEGCIAFRGNVRFLCFNKSKIDKYHIKTYKVVDSSNNYALRFDLYVGDIGQQPVTPFGKIYDLVMDMCKPYLGHSYHIYMDNWYTSPSLVYSLRQLNTYVTGTVKENRVGFPPELKTKRVKDKGDMQIFSYGDEMRVLKIFDRKPVRLLSSRFTAQMTPTGKSHWKTKVPTRKPEMIIKYNKYMGGVDCNDQMLQYSPFNRRSLKWWKKVAFRLLNIAMCNAYILYKEWFMVQYPNKPKPKHADYRLSVIKLMMEKAEYQQPIHKHPINVDAMRLSGQHFPQFLPSGKKQLRRACQVCTPAFRRINKRANIDTNRGTNPGNKSNVECKKCSVALCISPCFEFYHTHQDYVQRYVVYHDKQ